MANGRRIGVFVFFDKQGVVDDYVVYLLKDLIQNLDKLVIVCNGHLTPEGREKLCGISKDIFVRSNKGFDAGAYKDAFEKQIGWDELLQYDELVMCNDTFYGPFWPFREVFEKMDTRPELDFWGLTVHSKMVGSWWRDHNKYGYLPAHLQSYFLVVRSKLLHAEEFKAFWSQMDTAFDTVDEVIASFETSFTKVFEDAGFLWAPYADTRVLDDAGEQYIINHNVYNCDALIEKFRCPIIKRRAFTWGEMLDASDGGNAARALEYIQKCTSYDTGLIYSHLLRVENLSLLKRNLHWDYILPKNQISLGGSPVRPGTVLVVFHMYYPDLVDTCVSYLLNLPPFVDILVTTSNPAIDKKTLAGRLSGRCSRLLGVVEAPKQGRDIAAFLVTARETMKKYEYVCFTHDKKASSEAHYPTIGENFRRLITENVLASQEYVTNVVHLFQSNPRLGVAAPPSPFMGEYLSTVADAWQNNYESVVVLAEKLGLHCNIDEENQPYILGTSLWFRTKALLPLLDCPFTEADFPQEPVAADGTVSHAIERIFPYVAQSQGYYSAWIMTEEYASLYVEQFNYMLSAVLSQWKKVFIRLPVFEAFLPEFKMLLKECSGDEKKTRSDSQVWGAKEAFFAWDEDLVRAAGLAERHEEAGLETIGFAAAWSVFRISLSVWRKKHSFSKLDRKLGQFMALQKIPSVSQTWWLVRKTFVIWIKKTI
jgi:rhamnosyltransferase